MPDPPTITAITPTKRDPLRVSVKVDGEVVAKLSVKSVGELGLCVGGPWDASLAGRVKAAAGYDQAMHDALVRLNRRALSEWQLERKLLDRGHDEVVIARVLERLISLNLIDDEAFGRALIRELTGRQPAGPHLLRSRLSQCRLPSELIDRLVAEATSDTRGAVQRATALARQKMRSLGGLDEMSRKRRLWGLLARRGFESDTIEQALHSLGDAVDDE